MIASAPSSGPFAYDKVFERLRAGGGNNSEEATMVGSKEKYYDPATMTALEFGLQAIETKIYKLQHGQSLQEEITSLQKENAKLKRRWQAKKTPYMQRSEEDFQILKEEL